MTYTNKIYEFILNKKQVLLTSFIIAITLFGMMNTLNVYAQVEANLIPAQEIMNESNKSTGVAVGDTDRNVATLLDSQVTSAVIGGTKFFGGVDIFEGATEQREYAELSETERIGALGVVSKQVNALMYNPPQVNIAQHLSEEWIPGYSEQQTGVYAESGYQYLKSSGLAGIWNYFRNIAYILFVVVMIVAGFMVMFRKKIGGQLLVTVYNTIPRVIGGLILVTFSFAIVGIIIDIGGMLINVASSALLSLSGNKVEMIGIEGPFSLLGIPGENTGAYLEALAASFGTVGLGNQIVIVLGTLFSGLLFPITALVIFGVTLFASIRVYITLLKSYLALIIDLALAPIFIAFGTFPGSQAIMNWLKRVVKNVLVFVFVFFFVNLGFALIASDISLGFPRGLSVPGSQIAATGDDLAGFILKLLLPILLMFFAADAPKMIEDFLPSNGGKGFAGAVEGFKGGLQKIPLFGGMVK